MAARVQLQKRKKIMSDREPHVACHQDDLIDSKPSDCQLRK
jgi:hypothetical protein